MFGVAIDSKEVNDMMKMYYNNLKRKNKMKLKIGDRVEVIDKLDSLYMKGEKGTIRMFQKNCWNPPVGVEFDKDFPSGHNLNGVIKKFKGRFGNENELKLLTQKKDKKMSKKKLPKATLKDIKEVLDIFFLERIIFTKYDVTKQLRHNSIKAVHKKVRKMLDNDLVIPGDYNESNSPILPGNPVIYCPNEELSTDYDPEGIPEFDVTKKSKKAKKKSDKITNVTSTSKKSTSKTKSLFDKRNRYSIKAKITRDASFAVGDEVCIVAINNGIKLTEVEFATAKDRKATVDCYYNIRVPKDDFIKAFGNVPLSIKTEASKKLIEITEN